MTPRPCRTCSPWFSWKLLRGAFAAALAAACGEDRMLVPPPAPPPQTGTLLVSSITTGGDPDGDGYRLVVDRGPGTAVPVMGAVSLTLDPGTHEVELAEVASQCVVAGGSIRTVGIAAGVRTDLGFQVSCPLLGSLLVTVVTTGGDPDADGYLFRVDNGPFQPFAPSDSRSMEVAEGSHSLELAGLAPQCEATGGKERTVVVSGHGQTATTFQVYCPVLGAISVTTGTSGTELDPDGYELGLDGQSRGHMGLQDARELGSLRPGEYRVRLSSVAGNCTVASGASRLVTVTEAASLPVAFAVECVPRTDDTPGEKLVVSQKDPNGEDFDLFIMNADGSGRQRLTDRLGDEFSPEISPDGSRILYLGQDGSNRRLWVMDRASRQTTALPTTGVDGAVWARDAENIGFTKGGSIYRMKADGTGETPLTRGNNDRDPFWSPDGTRIAFTRDGNIWLMNPDGSGQRQLAGPPAAAGPWSSDGRKLVATLLNVNCNWYCYYYGPTWSPTDMVLLDVGTGAQTPLTQTPDLGEWSPAWAPDGGRIYFLATVGGISTLSAIRPDGTGLTSLGTQITQWVSAGLVGGSASALRATVRRR